MSGGPAVLSSVMTILAVFIVAFVAGWIGKTIFDHVVYDYVDE